MDIAFLLQLCGIPLAAVISLLSIGLTTTALLLTFRFRHRELLGSLTGLCLLPFLAGICSSLLQMLFWTRQIQLDSEGELLPGFVLMACLIPMLFGAAGSAIPATVTLCCRWMLDWKASGLQMIPERPEPELDDERSEQERHEAWVEEETDEYLAQVLRAR